MNRLFKTFSLWLLMLAFSMQGIAAAAQISCGPEHHGTIASLSKHQHNAGADVAHHHDGDDGHALPDADRSDNAIDKGQAVGASQCSACAACCVSAVIAPSVMNWATEYNGSHPVLVPPPFLVSGHIPDGLKRPPKANFV